VRMPLRPWCFLALLPVLALCGCARKQAPPPPASAPVEFASTSRIATVERPADSTLAYAHQVAAEVPADGLLQRLDAVRAACVADRANACTVLDVVRSNDGGVPSGRLTVRLAPAGVDPLVRLAGSRSRPAAGN